MAPEEGPLTGELATCPQCGREVLRKQMIPVLADAGAHTYLCVECARSHRDPQVLDAPG